MYLVSHVAIQFSIIVDITSWTPLVTFSIAAGRDQSAPKTMAKSSATNRCTPGGRTKRLAATAPTAPRYTWPSAPMLKRPAFTPTRKVSAVRTRGVAIESVEAHFSMSPKAPLKRARYAWMGS